MAVTDFDIPEYRHEIFRERRTRYCTIIPVLNEGERFQRQLRRMYAEGITAAADVIIADGGSTDHSVKQEFLRGCDARALLVKTGPGKLSAQLRMAYAFALQEGYDGIITIDGNGKDSPESIPLFIAALDEGIDYAQASRFIKGAKEENTPLIRRCAIRILHAPLLSVAAGHWFTDTTQGFRAYSRRYLEHPEVQPFRSIFQTYELLPYLTVRASQLSLNVREIPTTRRYPPTGPTPTKITKGGTLKLLRILLATVAGRYHPRS